MYAWEIDGQINKVEQVNNNSTYDNSTDEEGINNLHLKIIRLDFT
jgi:hypothetical protein